MLPHEGHSLAHQPPQAEDEKRPAATGGDLPYEARVPPSVSAVPDSNDRTKRSTSTTSMSGKHPLLHQQQQERHQSHRFQVDSVLNDNMHDHVTSNKFAKIFATGDFPPVTFFSWHNCPTPELISADPGIGGQLIIHLAPLQQRFAKHFQGMQTQRRRQLHSNIISAILAVITFITSVISTVLAQGAGSRGATIATTVVTVIGSGLNSLFLSMGLIKTTSFGQQAAIHAKIVREIMAIYFQIKSGMFNDRKEELIDLIIKQLQIDSDQSTVEE